MDSPTREELLRAARTYRATSKAVLLVAILLIGQDLLSREVHVFLNSVLLGIAALSRMAFESVLSDLERK